MYGLAMIEIISLSGHLSNIDKIIKRSLRLFHSEYKLAIFRMDR